MLPNPENYSIYPSVVPADTQVLMTIAPTERAFIFFNDVEYTIKITPINSDECSYYYAPTVQAELSLTASRGIITFNYTFADEQEYLIRLYSEDKIIGEFHIYSLFEDLYSLKALRGDFHGHSYRSDGKRDPSALAGHYREQGYDFFALTDHNRYYPGNEIDEAYNGVKLGFTRVLGEELHTPGSPVHIVHVGGKSSVCAKYINDLENYQKEKDEYLTKVPSDIPEKYAEKYAMAMWATDNVHKVGGLAIFAHPYWIPGASQCYNVCDELAKILLKSGMFDAYELVGCMSHSEVSRSVALWSDLRAEGYDIAVVGSSDVHGLKAAHTFPNHFTVCFAESNENDAIIKAVKAKTCVAVDAIGNEYDRVYTTYGKLRYVSYANFLLKYYFPWRVRNLAGQGVTMRAYAMGAVSKTVIEEMDKMNEEESERFFGRRPALVPDDAMLEFEEKHRQIHLNKGPITKGSSISSTNVTRQV